MLNLALAILAALVPAPASQSSAAPAPATVPAYSAGQVWEYRARPEDAGSLVKIQQVEQLDGEAIYHVTLKGIRLDGKINEIQHLPVSRQTLAASVTRPAADPGDFPDPAEGIAMWREAEGGVFTIPLAEIVAIVDQTLPPSEPNTPR